MLKALRLVLKYGLPLLFSAWALPYFYHQLPLAELRAASREIRQFWVWAAFVANLANHGLRAWRWKYLLQAVATPVRYAPLLVAEMTGFFANLIFPRLGEVVRCLCLQRMTGVRFSLVLGTVVSERLLDVSSFSLLTCVALLLEGPGLRQALIPWLVQRLSSWPGTGLLPFLGIGLSFLFVLWRFPTLRVRLGLHAVGDTLWRSVRVLWRMQQPVRLWSLTLLVWGAYFLVGQLSFYALPATAHLGPAAGVAAFVASNLSMAAPLQGGGLGAYHLLVGRALQNFGILRTPSLLYATLTHGLQLVTGFVVGGLAALVSSLWPQKDSRA